MVDSGFVQGQSDNLPRVDIFMMSNFFATHGSFISAEIRGVKASRSIRESYGDNSVGYVQVKRTGDICIVKARITPEHKVRAKAYSVTFVCNEVEEIIESCQCHDCAASQGGCKHALAFVAWLNRRSEEPARTSTMCYWRKSKMAGIGTSKKFITAKEMGKDPHPDIVAPTLDDNFLTEFVQKSIQLGAVNTQLTKYFTEPSEIEKISMQYLVNVFTKTFNVDSAKDFIDYCKNVMDENACKMAATATLQQAECNLWHSLRFARITASKIYEAAHCATLNGALTETILGAKIFETVAINRGKLLEAEVLKEVENVLKIKFKKCGLLLSKEHPIFGASPDALADEFVVEVKCPMTESSAKRYFTQDNEPSPKYMAQMQLQMHFAKKKKALFCVAAHDFETSKNVKKSYVNYDEILCRDIMEKASKFWNIAIFTKIII